MLAARVADDRARVAIYALARCARFVPDETLSTVLQPIAEGGAGKVTSRKEAIRLLARHRAPGALDMLIGLSQTDGLHRDLRIAVGRSFREYLDHDQSWACLERLATGGRDEALSLLETTPWHLGDGVRPRYAALVVAASAHADADVRRAAFEALPAWSSWTPAPAELAAHHVVDLASGPSWRAAAAGLVALFGDGVGVELTATTLRALATDRTAPDSADRDLPSRQRLAALVTSLQMQPIAQRSRLRPELGRCADALTIDPTSISNAVALRLAALDWRNPAPALASLSVSLQDRPLAAVSAAGALGAALQRDRESWEPAGFAPLVTHLLTGGAASEELLALAIIAAAGPRAGWPPFWRAALSQLRGSAIADVADAAKSVNWASE